MKVEKDKLELYADRLVGTRLARIRKMSGYRQYEIAKLLGLTTQQVCNYEKGNCQVPFGVLVKIAFILDCSCADILDPREFDSLKSVIEDIKYNRKGEVIRVGDVEDE